jgi:tape measure domain-containing protein
MQIAKMFASLGFKVDTSGLKTFKASLANARGEMTNLGRGVKHTTGQLRGLTKQLSRVDTQLNKIRGAAANKSVREGYNNIASAVRRLDTALSSITAKRPATTKAIGKINASVRAGIPHWQQYTASVIGARRALGVLNRDLTRLRANSRVDVRIRNTGGGGGGGRGGAAGAGGLGALGAGLGLRGFMNHLVPSMALTGIGGAIGYGGVKAVGAAREQTSMESMILMTAKSAEEFRDTVDYVNKEGLRLGLNSAELGKSFAQISMSASTMTHKDKKEMFTGFSEFMMAMGTNEDDQKGIFRAFNQMFSNNRILQEEINQLSDRGIPATLIYDSAMKAYGLDNVAQVKKLQEAGKLDPQKVLKLMSSMLQEKAHTSGAFDKMRDSSMFKQNQFKSQMRQASKTIMDMGLDKMLGDIFGMLTGISKELVFVSKALKGIVDSLGELRSTLDKFTGGNGGLLMMMTLFIPRWRLIVLGLKRGLIVMRNGGAAALALGEVLKGFLGRAIKVLIMRFGGWAAVAWGVWEAMAAIGEEMDKRDSGKWSIFDTMSVYADYALVKVKLLIAQLRWLEVYMKSGAMVNGGFDEFSDILKNKANRSWGNTKDFFGADFSAGGANSAGYEMGKKWHSWIMDEEQNSSGTPELSNAGYYEKNKPTTLNFNFMNKYGQTVATESAQLPATMAK